MSAKKSFFLKICKNSSEICCIFVSFWRKITIFAPKIRYMETFAIAIIDRNALSGIGLQQILENIIPAIDVRVFTTFEEFQQSDTANYIHFFVSSQIFFEHTATFRGLEKKTMVLVNGDLQVAGFRTLNVCQKASDLMKSVMALHGVGHPGIHRATADNASQLSVRETEVAVLLAQGLINKEVADRLNISLTTVISHRKNIMEKLHGKSLADIIIYCLVNGLISL